RSVPTLNDSLGQIQFSGFNGTGLTPSSRIRGILIETGSAGSSSMGGQLRFDTCPIGSATLNEVMRIDIANGLSLFGANSVIDQNRAHRLRSTTIAGAVSPSVGGNLFFH